MVPLNLRKFCKIYVTAECNEDRSSTYLILADVITKILLFFW